MQCVCVCVCVCGDNAYRYHHWKFCLDTSQSYNWYVYMKGGKKVWFWLGICKQYINIPVDNARSITPVVSPLLGWHQVFLANGCWRISTVMEGFQAANLLSTSANQNISINNMCKNLKHLSGYTYSISSKANALQLTAWYQTKPLKYLLDTKQKPSK